MTVARFKPIFLLPALALMACQPAEPPAQPEAAPEEATGTDKDFAAATGQLIDEMLARNPEWAVRQGHYEHAARVTIPDAAQRRGRLAFIEQALAELERFDPETMPADERTDHALLTNHLESARWYQETFRNWAWMPSRYNVADTLNVLLNTDFAALDERLRIILARLEHVPAYYRAARDSIETPTLEHTALAISQNRGTLEVLADIEEQVSQAGLDDAEHELFATRLDAAADAINGWIEWLEQRHAELAASGEARGFRIGEAHYRQKFAYDIQSPMTAGELYQRALEEKQRLHAEMDEYAVELWPKYFPDEAMPDEPLERIGRLVDRLSEEHVALEDFVDEIRRQIPQLAEFVRENDLLFQDPDKPLVVRETPEYMRGTGAIASVNAPGPFNPDAETYYNVTPLEHYGPELAASYLREYNDWMLQILNIHEAIPGHYTQLLHANRSPSLVKRLFGSGAMVEGWAVYAERMMLEAGWGDHEPELWFMHGKWLLRVTFNAILDYAVHVLGMERDEAIALMREEAFQEHSEASQKWRRLTLTQVQLTSYFSGYADIYDFREQQRERLGEDFDLTRFHNQFLGYGSAPVNVIVELMGDD